MKSRNYDYFFTIGSLFLAIIMVFPYLYTGKIIANSDWLFHASRVEEIYRNLCQGHIFTYIATTTFHHSGSGSFLFYPTIFFYPWVFLRLFLNPIVSFYIWVMIINWFAFLISYFSMKDFSHSRRISILFSLLYVFNSYRIYLSFWPFGEFVASSILPLVFLSFYRVFFDENKNLNGRSKLLNSSLLGISMSLLIYTHLVSVIITLEIFTGILTAYSLYGNFNRIVIKWKEMIISIFITTVLCLPIIYIFVGNYIGKGITSTYFGVKMDNVRPLSDILKDSINAMSGWTIGFILIVVLALGWFYSLNKKEFMSIYLCGACLLIISSSIFPWWLLKNTFLGIIQMPYRYLSYSCLFLSIVGAFMLWKGITRFSNSSYKQNLLIVVFLVITLGLYLNSIEGSLKLDELSKPTNLIGQQTMTKLPGFTILSTDNYSNQFNYLIPWGETDYYPKKAFRDEKEQSIIKQITYVNKKVLPNIKASYLPNKVNYKVNLRHSSNIDLPIVAYNNTLVKINGHSVQYKESSRGTVMLTSKETQAGKQNISVEFNPGIFFYVSVTISFFSWIWILVYYQASKKYRYSFK